MNAKKIIRKMLVFIFLIGLYASAGATTFEWELQSGANRTGLYGWIYNYHIGFYDDTLMVDVNVDLIGDDPGPTLMNIWEYGIERMWSTDRFDVPIAFNVDWVDKWYDYRVTVIQGGGRSDMLHWYTNVSAPDVMAAHEYGHMISMWDEYPESLFIDPVTGLVNTGGLMDNGGPTLDYYYDPFLTWYENKLAGIPTIIPVPETSIPEPATLLLFSSGLLGLWGWRKFKK
jgi:hypothetical protein